jgi:predicted phosphodiesterase
MNRNWFLGLLFFTFSCAPYKPFYHHNEKNWRDNGSGKDEAPEFTFYLIGDAGEPEKGDMSDVFKILSSDLKNADDDNSAVLFLGDNIYPHGLPDVGDKLRDDAEWRLKKQFEIFNEYKGRVIFLPGNHDWKEGDPEGLKFNLNQEKFTELFNHRGNIYLPDSACPGPVLIPTSQNSVLQVIDSQWWLHKYEKISSSTACEATSDSLFIAQLGKNFSNHKGKRMVVAAHHPMESNGPHGGKYPFRSHIFPLLEFHPDLWIPLPVLGSIYVLYRKIGNIQDIPHPRYKALQKRVEAILEEYPGSIYVNGHDHSLQYIRKGKSHYITSGAGTKHSHVVKNRKISFGYAGTGYAVLKLFKSDAMIEFYRSNNGSKELIYRKLL